MKCCNEERATPFCPACGKRLMRSEIQEVVERLRKLRRAALSHAARWLRDTPKDHHNYDFVLTQIDKLRERAEKYQRQIDAIEELHKKASKHE